MNRTEDNKGPDYPWTVQPRLRVKFVAKPSGLGFRRALLTEWIAFNCLTGYEGPRRERYEAAEMDVALQQCMQMGRRLATIDSVMDLAELKGTIGRTTPNVRR